ncbi:hypothetical protein [Janibacter sp. LM]|uniref:hypothetical protein n=1 Tax=Janibacter sp. LM TaxID=3144845 RepID=UPI0031F68C3A
MAQPDGYVTVSAEVPVSRKTALEAAKKGDGFSASVRINALLALWEQDPKLQDAVSEAMLRVQAERRTAAR